MWRVQTWRYSCICDMNHRYVTWLIGVWHTHAPYWYVYCLCVAVCCSVLQCVAVCCSVLRIHMWHDVFTCDIAVCSSVLWHVAMCCGVLRCVVHSCVTRRIHMCHCSRVAVCCDMLQCDAVCSGVLQCVARSFVKLCIHRWQFLWCSLLQSVAVCCSVLRCGAVWCASIRDTVQSHVALLVVCCDVLQCVAVYYGVLQCVAHSNVTRCIHTWRCSFIIDMWRHTFWHGPSILLWVILSSHIQNKISHINMWWPFRAYTMQSHVTWLLRHATHLYTSHPYTWHDSLIHVTQRMHTWHAYVSWLVVYNKIDSIRL